MYLVWLCICVTLKFRLQFCVNVPLSFSPIFLWLSGFLCALLFYLNLFIQFVVVVSLAVFMVVIYFLKPVHDFFYLHNSIHSILSFSFKHTNTMFCFCSNNSSSNFYFLFLIWLFFFVFCFFVFWFSCYSRCACI